MVDIEIFLTFVVDIITQGRIIKTKTMIKDLFYTLGITFFLCLFVFFIGFEIPTLFMLSSIYYKLTKHKVIDYDLLSREIPVESVKEGSTRDSKLS